MVGNEEKRGKKKKEKEKTKRTIQFNTQKTGFGQLEMSIKGGLKCRQHEFRKHFGESMPFSRKKSVDKLANTIRKNLERKSILSEK